MFTYAILLIYFLVGQLIIALVTYASKTDGSICLRL